MSRDSFNHHHLLPVYKPRWFPDKITFLPRIIYIGCEKLSTAIFDQTKPLYQNSLYFCVNQWLYKLQLGTAAFNYYHPKYDHWGTILWQRKRAEMNKCFRTVEECFCIIITICILQISICYDKLYSSLQFDSLFHSSAAKKLSFFLTQISD